MDDNKVNIENESLNLDSSNSVFTGEVKYLSKPEYFFKSLGSGLLNICLWIVNFLFTIVLSFTLFFKNTFIGIGKGVVRIGKYFKRKGHQFSQNDLWGRLSYVFFGSSNFAHRQYVNGILFILFEIIFIACFVLFGFESLAGLESLGTIDPNIDAQNGDNSTMILLYGLIWIVLICVFLFIWNASIESGYKNYRIANYKKYENITNDVTPYSQQYTEEIHKAFEEGVKKSIYQQEALVRFNDDFLFEYKTTHSSQEANYALYLIKNTISSAYAYNKKLIVLNKKLNKLNARKEQEISKIEQEIETNCNDVLVAKLTNKLVKLNAKHANKISKHEHKIAEFRKCFSSYAEMQNTKNSSVYGKYNVYYKHIASIDTDLIFYKNYDEFLEVYTSSFGGSEAHNEKNKQRLVDIRFECEDKIRNTKQNYESIRAKKASLKCELAEIKNEYALRVKEAMGDQQALIEAKTWLIEKSTYINNALNNLPGDNAIKSMEKEEIRESRHSYLRDKKFLKTNFTEEEYARQQVIDHMMLTYRVSFKDAVRFTNLLVKGAKNDTLNSAIAAERVTTLQLNKDAYINEHQDCFVGKPATFIEQMKSFLDSKFHITILMLPVLGIFIMTILPLIFSVVVAFTNFGVGWDGSKHTPPTSLFDWVGFENFKMLFSMGDEYGNLGAALLSTIGWTFLWAICATFSNYILGILVALMINKADIKFKKFWRTIFVLTIAIPQFISLVSISVLLKKGYAIDGLWTHLFGHPLNFGDKYNIELTKFIIILINIWVGIPYTILSTTGILINIPKDLYESSEVDGASKFTQFTKITMPYILFVTGPYLITQFVGNINNFNVIFFLSTEVPVLTGDVGTNLRLKPTDLLITFLYSLITDKDSPRYGLASAIGIVIFIICAFFSLVMYSKTGATQEEDQFQ